MLNGCPVIEKYNAPIARAPLAAAQISFCDRCGNRGVWMEQIDGPQRCRPVICDCGTFFVPGALAFKVRTSFSEVKS